MPEELWTEICNIVQESVIKNIPKKKKWKKAKWLSEEALQMAEKEEKQKEKEKKQKDWRKGKVNPSECRVQKNSKER